MAALSLTPFAPNIPEHPLQSVTGMAVSRSEEKLRNYVLWIERSVGEEFSVLEIMELVESW
jgi:hypothetical protein